MVLGAGVEPARPCGHQALNLTRLPFRHPSKEGVSNEWAIIYH